MTLSERYDVVVIGGGPAGEIAAQYAIQDSDRTCALVERELLGGECSYYACMPSKALLRPVELAAAAGRVQGLTGRPEFDPDGLLARRDVFTSHYDDAGQVEWARGAGIDVVRGRGRVVGERRVSVTGSEGARHLEATSAVVLATGSVSTVPDMYREVAPWSSRDATGLREVPGSLVIVGGGVVACEAATWLSALGSTVTMLVRGERLLARMEPFAGDLVADGLRDAGVDVRLGAAPDAVHRDVVSDGGLGRLHGGPVRVRLGDETMEADEILVATGRRPATDDLGLDSVGLTPDDIAWDSRTTPAWLFSVGDVNGSPMLTHWGKYQARLAGDRIARLAAGSSEAVAMSSPAPVPQVVFTDPQVASTGLTEAQARSRGLGVRVVDRPFSGVAGASLHGDDPIGQARLVIDTATGTIVGATFAGAEAGELLHAASIAVVGRVPLEVLWHAVPSYPTVSEIWLHLLEAARRPESPTPGG